MAPPTLGTSADKMSGYRVLLLYSEARLTPSVVSMDQALRSTLEAGLPGRVHFYTEFLDLNSFHGAELQRELGGLLRVKYRQRPIDLIVAQGQLSVPFVLGNREAIFSGAPVVFVAVEASAFDARARASGITGTWRHRAWRETLELAGRLHPGTRRAVVVVGSSAAERLWLASAREQLADRVGPIAVSYLVDRSFDDALKEIAALPANAVVLAGPFLRDGAGRDFVTPVAIGKMAAAARVPIYGLTEGSIGTGAVGGQVVSFVAHGKVAADLALRVLSGERPPPTDAGTTVAVLDDRQIRRWGIELRRVPQGSAMLFHQPSLWEVYRGYAVAAVVVLVVQGGLIGFLLAQRAKRRRAQQGLAERLRFETILSDLSAALSSCSTAEIDAEIEAALRRIVDDLGADRATIWSLDDPPGEARATHAWTRAGVPPIAAVLQESQFPTICAGVRKGHILRLPSPEEEPGQSRVDRESLEQIHARSAAVAPLVEGGRVVGALSLGTVLEERPPEEFLPRLRLLADIFANALARQRAERAARESAKDIRSLAGRLMTAEEDERRRIARELHDGVNQDLAALSIALSALQDGVPEGSPGERRQEFARLQGRTVELAEAIRHLSHELHPGILQYAGLAAALRSHCREFERDHGLAVKCHSDEDLGAIPSDVALCLYRATQEALKNAFRHARASHVWVTVRRENADLALTIVDDGDGFDLAEAQGRGGLGLISLAERVRLAGGRLSIDTKPQRGTEITVVVTLPPL